MHLLFSPTDSDLALGNIAKTSQKEISAAAAAELSSAQCCLHVFQSALCSPGSFQIYLGPVRWLNLCISVLATATPGRHAVYKP